MGCFAETETERRNGRDHFAPEGFSAWCRIEDLSRACGYDPEREFGALREIAARYRFPAGREPEDYAEEHPLQALACAVSRYLAEYPQAAAAEAAAAANRTAYGRAAERQAGRVA